MNCRSLVAASLLIICSTSVAGAQSQTTGSASTKQRPGRAKRMIVPPAPVVPILRPTPAGRTATQAAANQAAVTLSSSSFTVKETSARLYRDMAKLSPADAANKLVINLSSTKTNTKYFTWMKVFVGNTLVATDKNLKDGKATIDVSGKLVPGVNYIAVEGQAPPGTVLNWDLVSLQQSTAAAPAPRATAAGYVSVNRLRPGDEVVVGEDFEISGSGFDPSNTTVFLDKMSVVPQGIAPDRLTLKIPANHPGGRVPVTVKVGSAVSQPLYVVIRPIPEVTGTNLDGCPPGYPLEIFGNNFSDKISEVKVTFGGAPGHVMQASKTALVVTVPDFYNGMGTVAGQAGIAIKVKVGKAESKENATISIGNSVWQDPGFRGGPDTPFVPSPF